MSSSRPTATKSSTVSVSPTIPTPTMLAWVNRAGGGADLTEQRSRIALGHQPLRFLEQ